MEAGIARGRLRVIVAIAAVCIGYGTGTIIGHILDGCYTDAPLRLLLPWRADRKLPLQLWAGTAGYVIVRRGRAVATIPPAYFCYLPLIGAGASLAIAVRARDLRHALLLALFSMFLAALAATDFERHLLPNRLMYPAVVLAFALGWAWPASSWIGSWVASVEGGALALGLMLVWFLIDRNLGFGDVKLAALLGLLSGITLTLTALAVAALAGGLAALFMVLLHKAGRGSLIAYGPYLALGAFVGMLLR
jgi:leader peptidase (prepilin peptidase)/N-methyltransferase